MPMRTATLAVLIAAGVGMTPEELAFNYNRDADRVEEQLDTLESEGYVECRNGVYFANGNARSAILTIGGVSRADSVTD